MIGFFEFMENNAVFILAFVIAGFLMGLAQTLGEPWKNKMGYAGIAVAIWGFVVAPLLLCLDYGDYKRHYATCEKYEAKQAGYILSDFRCYKPIANGVYVKVNQVTKTKQELLNAK